MNKDYDNSLQCYEKAIEIGLKILPVNNIELIQVYENIDQFYYDKNTSNILISISSNDLLRNKQYTSLTYNTTGNIFDKMNNYQQAILYCQSAYQLESRMPLPNVLYIEKYKDNISRVNNKISNFTFKKLMQILCTIYEYLFNSG